MEETADTGPNPTSPTVDAKPTKKAKFYKKPIFIVSIAGVILIIATGVGIYSWQRGIVNGLMGEKSSLEEKVASQSAQLEKLGKESRDLKSKMSFLEKSLREATASAQFEFGELTIAAAKGEHFLYESEGGPVNLVLVDVTMKNNTEQNLFLSALNFKLKDTNNKSYSQAEEGIYKLPSGKVIIFDQQMAAGETVSGTLVFAAPKTISLFTLFYDTHQLTLTVK